MVPITNTSAPKLSEHFADTIPEGSVICISQPENMINAVWGGLMTARAQIRGALGVVVDGRIRDLNEQREAGFPVGAIFNFSLLHLLLLWDISLNQDLGSVSNKFLIYSLWLIMLGLRKDNFDYGSRRPHKGIKDQRPHYDAAQQGPPGRDDPCWRLCGCGCGWRGRDPQGSVGQGGGTVQEGDCD